MRTLVRRCLIEAYETKVKRRGTFRYWRELEETQSAPRAAIEALQFQRLQQLVEYAFAHCPYYRELWSDLGLAPDKLESPADFAQWPVTERATIREHRLAMRAAPPGRLIAKATGGSSGTPLHFDIDHESYERRNAATYRGYSWAGAGPGTRQLYLWGVPLGKRSRSQRYKDRLYDALHGRTVLNSFDFNTQSALAFLDRHNRRRPDVIVAYTNPLYLFARFLSERGLVPYAPRGIVVGAEKLHPFQRALIEQVFQAPVFETYGSREFMLIGAECDRHEGLHLTAENLVVEVVDEAGRPTPEGEEGDVVVTDLTNRGMPFIRYRIGDRAVAGFGACSCGRGLPLLRQVVGRRLDVLSTPDGRRIPGEFFPHLLKDFAAVERFQVVQEDPARIELRAVLGPGWTDQDRQRVEQVAANVLGPSVEFAIKPVADIPLTAAGKHQVVVNRTATSPHENQAAEARAV